MIRTPGRVAKDVVRRVFEAAGLEISRRDTRRFGKSPYEDVAFHLRRDNPIVFDVGANEGQSVTRILKSIPRATIHSFEPSPAVFRRLVANTQGMDQTRLWNCAVGSTRGEVVLNENLHSDLSSVLPLGPSGWGKIVGQSKVECRAIDEFVESEGIDLIDVLKVDTQGFELEVFRGAELAFRSNKIGMVLFEMNFAPLYQGLPTMPQLFEVLTSHGLRLVSIYDIHHDNGVAGWADALFVNDSYRRTATVPSTHFR